MAEAFPPSWFVCERKDDVIEMLQHWAISGRDKKIILQEWSIRSGCPITAEDVMAVTGLPYGAI